MRQEGAEETEAVSCTRTREIETDDKRHNPEAFSPKQGKRESPPDIAICLALEINRDLMRRNEELFHEIRLLEAKNAELKTLVERLHAQLAEKKKQPQPRRACVLKN